MKATRTYTMTARAQSVQETRRRILEVCFALGQTTRLADISLAAVAEESHVSVQTILRQFGSRAGMMAETAEFAASVIREERGTPVGDVAAAVRVVVDHYELRGHTALLLLAQEDEEESIAAVVAGAKRQHREWVQAAFAPFIAAGASEDLLVVATDVYTWKLLRRDRGLSRRRTQTLMHELVTALITSTDRSP